MFMKDKDYCFERCKKAVDSMGKECLELKVECSFCVTDCMENILLLEKMDNASSATLGFAEGKVITALKAIMPTREVDNLIRKGNIKIGCFAGTCKTTIWGGFPIYENKKDKIPIGSIGVSGGSWEQNEFQPIGLWR